MNAIRNRHTAQALSVLVFLWSFPLCLGQDQDFGFVEDDAMGFPDDTPAGFALDSMEVQSGEAQWGTVNNEFQITASDGAQIQYFSGFDIPTGETVRFIQPSADATVINQIMTQTPTQIDGNLIANGKVVLLNSSGIVF